MEAKVDEQIKQHYVLEKSLAQRILASSCENRRQIIIEAYDELFSKITWHSLLNESEEKKLQRLTTKQTFFEPLVNSHSAILDIGAGTGFWVRYLAKKGAGRYVGIDASKEILVKRPDDPPNLEFYIMDATELNFPPDSFDVAFSSQLIEHLHPDDVEVHFASVYRVLKENGLYAFDTPSRITGPHDISKHFDEVASGFHLKEWVYGELAAYLKKVGFRKVQTMALPWRLVKRFPPLRGLGTVPVSLLTPGENLAKAIKHKKLRMMLCKVFRVFSIYIIAQK